MTQYRSLPQFFLLLFTFLLSACSSVSHLTREDEAITSSLQPVKERYAPDRRIRGFDIRWERQGSRFVVKGEVDDAAAREDAVSAIRTTIGRDVIDSVRVLPDETVGQRRFGIVTVSVANMRSRPAQPAELATQVLMGMVVKLLKYEGGWYYVQSHDQYLAWLEPDAMVVIDRAGVEAWEQTQKVIVTEPYGLVRQKPDRNAFPVSDLVAGALLKKKGTDGGWVKVALPDGTEGFVEQAIVEDESTWRVTRVASPETI
jgi:SH3-like domain-containing protein